MTLPPSSKWMQDTLRRIVDRLIHSVPIAREGLSSRAASELLGGAVLLAL